MSALAILEMHLFQAQLSRLLESEICLPILQKRCIGHIDVNGLEESHGVAIKIYRVVSHDSNIVSQCHTAQLR